MQAYLLVDYASCGVGLYMVPSTTVRRA